MNTEAVTNRFPDYEHTQIGKLHYIFLPVVALDLVLAWIFRHDPLTVWIILGFTMLMLVIAGMFRTLTIRDEGEHLLVQFGPIPGFRKRIAYEEIKDIEPAKSRWIDGWGIHYVPREGWIWNLWGFDCVRLKLSNSTLRIGSDDVENLVPFLQDRIARDRDSA